MAIIGPPIPVEVIIALTKKAAPHKVNLCLIAAIVGFRAITNPRKIIKRAIETLRAEGLEFERIYTPTGTPIIPKITGTVISR
jgi:hypothetical protein